MSEMPGTPPGPADKLPEAALLQLVFDHAGEGISVFDPALRLLAWNQRFIEFTGLPPALVMPGAPLRELLLAMARAGEFGPCDIESEVAQRLAALRDHPASVTQRTRPGGRTIELRRNPTPGGGFVMLYADVTERMQAEDQLRRTSALLAEKSRVLEITLQSLSQGVLTINPAGRITAWNRRALDLLELTDEVMCAHPTLAALSRYQMAHGLIELGSGNGIGLERPKLYQRTRRDGLVLEVRTTSGEDGSVVRTYTDVTASMQAQRALADSESRFRGLADAARAAKDEAERANRAKSEFLSRMSHELRTPLNAVLGFAQLLQTDAADPLTPSQRARVDELMRGGGHLLSLINEVLDLARIEAGALQLQLVPVALRPLVDGCLPLVQAMARARCIDLRLRPPALEGCQVLADATRLRQVLLNLLSNAIKYNRHGGEVELAWSGEPDTGTVTIEVRDTGPGIDAAQQARLFQPFERLLADQTEVEGAGIGLALSKWIVELMQGSVGLRSSPGAGSTFWVRLRCAGNVDAAARKVAATERQAAAAAPASARQQTVLYIEDNAVNQVLMEGMLAQRPGVRLLIAGLPEAGLEMAAQARPDLVLLDIQLPGIDGFEVLRRLRAQESTRDVPVVAVSANAMQSDLDDARRAGFADYVTKPMDLQRLLAVVDGLLDTARRQPT